MNTRPPPPPPPTAVEQVISLASELCSGCVPPGERTQNERPSVSHSCAVARAPRARPPARGARAAAVRPATARDRRRTALRSPGASGAGRAASVACFVFWIGSARNESSKRILKTNPPTAPPTGVFEPAPDSLDECDVGLLGELPTRSRTRPIARGRGKGDHTELAAAHAVIEEHARLFRSVHRAGRTRIARISGDAAWR